MSRIFGGKSPTLDSNMEKVLGDRIGPLVATLSKACHGYTMPDVKVALSILLAFTIDTFDDKETARDEAVSDINSLVSFEKGAYRGRKYTDPDT